MTAAMGLIWDVPEEERGDLIHKALRTNDPKTMATAAEMIWAVPVNQMGGLIRMALETQDLETMKVAAGLIRFAPPKQSGKLIKQLFTADDRIFTSSLYRNNHDIESGFTRRPFEKTGSETTLLGGELYEKIIVRTIKTESFLAWKHAYEAYSTWQDAGFDYVPIEPFFFAVPTKNSSLTRVYTAVLDCNYTYWKKISNGVFYQELEAKKAAILSTISSLRIFHGHLHDDNYVLRFFRHNDGSIDLTQCPRLYAIDFDRAIIV
jgi:hypothetical protein